MNEVSLSEIFAEAVSGYWGKDPGELDEDVRVVRNGDVLQSGSLRWNDLPVRAFKHSEALKSSLAVGDLLLTTSGDCARVGFVDRVLELTCASNFVRRLRVDPDRADSRYVFHLMNSQHFRSMCAPFIRGTTLQNLSVGPAFESVKLSLPPIEEQRRIAAVLDAADELRAKRRETLAKLNALTDAIFIEMFGDPTRGAAETKAAIGDLAEVITGNTPPRSQRENYGNHLEWLKSDNILESGAVSPALEYLSETGRSRGREAPAGSCLVVCIAGSARSIGRVGLLDREAAFNQQINAIVPGPQLLPEFLFQQLRVGKRLVQRASTNSMKGMVSKSALLAVEILVPALADQLRFVSVAQHTTALARQSTAASVRLDELLAMLKQRAIRGTL